MRFLAVFLSVFLSALLGSRETTPQAVPSVAVTGLGRRVLRTDLNIQQQADQILANKQARELREDRRAAHECGCPQCRQAYRLTLAFYAGLGLRPPTREYVSIRGLTWYARLSGAGPVDAR